MIAVGTPVGWRWFNGLATGIVVEVHPTRHEIISKGKRFVRNGSKDDPAIVIIADNKSALVLKLVHEVQILDDKVKSDLADTVSS